RRARLSRSGDSTLETRRPSSCAILPISFSRTVLPVPRKPRSMIDRALRPLMARPHEILEAVRISSRPASSGGLLPAPGAKGLRYGSIQCLRAFIPEYPEVQCESLYLGIFGLLFNRRRVFEGRLRPISD